MRRQTRLTRARRSGFTLVELLVAASLCILTMSILALAFQQGLGSLSHLKATVGLSEKLRAAEAIILRDLRAKHLEDENGVEAMVSDAAVAGQAWTAPKRGFLRITHGSVPLQSFNATPPAAPYPQYISPVNDGKNPGFFYEGTDGDGLDSFRATDHSLSMTVKLPALTVQTALTGSAHPQAINDPQNPADFNTIGGQFSSNWAEVLYYLRPTPVQTVDETGTGRSMNLFTLYRRTRILAPRNPITVQSTPPALGSTASPRENFPELSLRSVPVPPPNPAPPFPPVTVNWVVNTPADVTDPRNRTDYIVDWHNYSPSATPPAQASKIPPPLVPPPLPLLQPSGYAEVILPGPAVTDGSIMNANAIGTDLLMSNVVSFQVRILTDTSGGQFIDRPGGASTFVYESSSATKPRLRAIQIKLRVYDTKVRLTRQMTITQDL